MSPLIYPPYTPSKVLSYQPSLMGANSDPTVTYTTRVGQYCLQQNGLVWVSINLVTSNVVKATNLTDAIRMSLPVPAINTVGQDQPWIVQSSGGGALGQNANSATINANTQYLTLATQGLTSLINLTYTLIGVLSNQLKFSATGWYQAQ